MGSTVRATVWLAVASPARRGARDARVFDRDVAQELQALGLFAESGAGNLGAERALIAALAELMLAAAHETGEAQQLGRAPPRARTALVVDGGSSTRGRGA